MDEAVKVTFIRTRTRLQWSATANYEFYLEYYERQTPRGGGGESN